VELSAKLKQLEENLSLLRELKEECGINSLKNDKRVEWELRYGLFESIQILIDISCKIVNSRNLGYPKNYRECLELLAQSGYIDTEKLNIYRQMVGLRNLLIHEYATIDSDKLYSFLENLSDFESFIEHIYKTELSSE